MKRKLIVIFCAIIFIVDFLLIKFNQITCFDNAIYNFVIGFKSDTVTNIMKFLSFIASTKFIVTLNIIIFVIILWKKYKKLAIIIISSICSVIFNNLFKFIVRRDRPVDIALVTEKFYSFPSGHSMICVLFYGSIIYLINKYKVKYAKIISAVIIACIILIGMSRIYLGVHFASDIIGGWALALIVLLSIINIWEKREKSEGINNRSK